MSDTVCAVVVTYNRKKLLLECLEALRKQTRPVQGIYLIDNASTDGTPALLLEKGYIKELPPENLTEPWEKEFEIKNLTDGEIIKLHYVRMHENTGSSGGFHEGVKRAYEKGYDWLWLMDDDVESYYNALEKLLHWRSMSKCIHPSKNYADGDEFFWESWLDLTTGNLSIVKNPSFKNGKEFCCVNILCFEGVLLHSSIIEKAGFPLPEFFIGGDDVEYGIRVSLYTNILYVKEAKFTKKLKPYKVVRRFGKNRLRYSNAGLYYPIRNQFLIFKTLSSLGFLKKYEAYTLFALKVLKILMGTILIDLSLERFFIVLKAVYDGWRGKYGKRI